MKKFTLFLMSMFLMLGTAVAQDKELTLVEATPADGGSVTNVDNIILKFSKDIVITIPEDGIAVTNESTKEVYRITSFNQYAPSNWAVFQFEQKKNEKDEMEANRPKDIGTYSYTIPAGCIKTADGEEFTRTMSFKIEEPVRIVNISPLETTILEKVEITFNEPIANVRSPHNLQFVDDMWMPIEGAKIKDEVAFSDDRKTVTLELENPVTTVGSYNLDIYYSTFTKENGIGNENKSVQIKVYDPTPAYVTNYTDGDKVKEIGDLEITFKNVKEVKLVDGADPITLYLPGVNSVTGTTTLDGNKITVTFDQEFTELGKYTFYIPAGVFTMDGAANEMREITVELEDSNITPLEITSISPEEDTVNELGKIVITFNQDVTLSQENWQQISREIKMTCGDKEYILTYNSESNLGRSLEYLVNAEWDMSTNQYKFTPITEEGEYTLDLSQIVVDHEPEDYVDEWGYPNTRWNSQNQRCSGTKTWKIVAGESSIEDIVVEEGAKVIYDLTGRRVETITAPGIYIVNSKKVLVK